MRREPRQICDRGRSYAREGRFPDRIAPHQPFLNLHVFTWNPAENVLASLSFEGDVFEMEDQRNWTDASFKTYCTPLARPFPVPMHPERYAIALKRGLRENQMIAINPLKAWIIYCNYCNSIKYCPIKENTNRWPADMNPKLINGNVWIYVGSAFGGGYQRLSENDLKYAEILLWIDSQRFVELLDWVYNQRAAGKK